VRIAENQHLCLPGIDIHWTAADDCKDNNVYADDDDDDKYILYIFTYEVQGPLAYL
jgi:hypothetical protein